MGGEIFQLGLSSPEQVGGSAKRQCPEAYGIHEEPSLPAGRQVGMCRLAP